MVIIFDISRPSSVPMNPREKINFLKHATDVNVLDILASLLESTDLPSILDCIAETKNNVVASRFRKVEVTIPYSIESNKAKVWDSLNLALIQGGFIKSLLDIHSQINAGSVFTYVFCEDTVDVLKIINSPIPTSVAGNVVFRYCRPVGDAEYEVLIDDLDAWPADRFKKFILDRCGVVSFFQPIRHNNGVFSCRYSVSFSQLFPDIVQIFHATSANFGFRIWPTSAAAISAVCPRCSLYGHLGRFCPVDQGLIAHINERSKTALDAGVVLTAETINKSHDPQTVEFCTQNFSPANSSKAVGRLRSRILPPRGFDRGQILFKEKTPDAKAPAKATTRPSRSRPAWSNKTGPGRAGPPTDAPVSSLSLADFPVLPSTKKKPSQPAQTSKPPVDSEDPQTDIDLDDDCLGASSDGGDSNFSSDSESEGESTLSSKKNNASSKSNLSNPKKKRVAKNSKKNKSNKRNGGS